REQNTDGDERIFRHGLVLLLLSGDLSISAHDRARRVPRGNTPKTEEFQSAAATAVGKAPEAPIGRGRSDHAIGAQFSYLGRALAGLAEDLRGVLTKGRRLALDAGAAVCEPKPRADQAHRPEARVDRLHHVAVAELRVLRDLLDLPDGRAWHVGGGGPRLPGLGLVRGQPGLPHLAP